ncbi:hypothetical protein LTR27_003383 [Elasticomyces elasticus]|nr:hypothetical protein LTR27_003383 [Elasticomyces elasticus]
MELVVRNSSHELDTTWSAEALREAALKLYTPIKDWQTRIIRLHPGTTGDPLTADLLVAGLAHGDGLAIGMDQNLISYEAVSYSWKEFKPCVPITINGQDYRLTESLAGALQRFRLEGTERYLWVDALCINQFDNSEKTAQVRNMFNIYYKAQKVLAWLGPEGDGTADAVTRATQTSEMESDSHDMLALGDLCSRPWARRVWIQQEVFAAKQLVLCCGPSEMNLETYQKIAKYLVSQQESPERTIGDHLGVATNAIMGLQMAGKRAVAAMELARVPTTHKHGPESTHLWRASWEPMYGLANILPRCKAFEASDPRDLIFALLGLTNCASDLPMASGMVQDETESEMEPDELKRPLHFEIDYTMSVTEVFQQATKYILNSDRSLLLLSTSGIDNLPPSDPLLPSWTIDWRTWQICRKFSDGYRRTTDERPDPFWLLQWQPAVNDGLLRLTGTIFGCVKSVAIDHEKLHDGLIYCHVVWEIHDAVPRTYTSHHQDGSEHPNPDSVVRNLRFPGRFAIGDIVVVVDGSLYNETLCLRPALDGMYRYVCMITDRDDLGLMMKDGIHKGCDSCDGGFDDSLVRQKFSDMVLQTYPECEREFVVC